MAERLAIVYLRLAVPMEDTFPDYDPGTATPMEAMTQEVQYNGLEAVVEMAEEHGDAQVYAAFWEDETWPNWGLT